MPGSGSGAKACACAAPSSTRLAPYRHCCTRRALAALACCVIQGQWALCIVLNVQPQNAFVVGTHDGHVQTFEVKGVAALWNTSEFGCEPSAQSVVIVVWYRGIEGPVENLYLGCPDCPPAVAAGLENGLFGVLVVFVFDVADNLFKNVFHGDKAGRSAMFVDDDGQMVTAAAEVVQQHVQALCFWNEYGRAYKGTQVDRWIGDRKEQVLGEQNAYDIVAIVFIHRKPGMTCFDNRR